MIEVLSEKIDNLFSCHQEMVQELMLSGIWLCLHISDKSLQPYTCYIVRYPPSPFLFVTGVRKTHLHPLMEAICLILDSSTCTLMDIAGKDLESVRSLVSDQHSQVHTSFTSS